MRDVGALDFFVFAADNARRQADEVKARHVAVSFEEFARRVRAQQERHGMRTAVVTKAKSGILVRCERWRACDDNSCWERDPHPVRREGRYSCRRNERCAMTGIACRCIDAESV